MKKLHSQEELVAAGSAAVRGDTPHQTALVASGGVCTQSILTEDLQLAPGTGLLPPSSPSAPLLIVLMAHLFREAHALAVLGTWAQPRCLRLLRPAASDASPVGWLLLQPFTFDASPQLDALRATLPEHHHVAFPHSFSATMRTEEALRRAHALHPTALWFFKGDDDTCVHPARLARALLARNASAPALVGHVAPLSFGSYRFVSGGAGYALSAPALAGLLPRLALCNGETSGFRLTSHEDVMITKCARDFFGDAVMKDEAGFNWGRPEQMLDMGLFSAAHLSTAAITHHYVDPQRTQLLLEPLYPRVLLQVWPFSGPPPATSWLGSLLPAIWESLGVSQQPSTSCNPQPSAALLNRIKECHQEALKGDFEYRLVPAELAQSLGVAQLQPLLQPLALEQLALLRALYLQGGIAVPLSESCEGLGVRLMGISGAAEAEGKQGTSDIDAPRRGLAISLSLSRDLPPRAWAAPQYHRGVFRLLAAQLLNISEALQEAREGTPACDDAVEGGSSARSRRSAALLHGGELAPLHLASIYNVPFARAPLVVATYGLWLSARVVLGELWLLEEVSSLAFGCSLIVADEQLPIERQLAVADIVLVGPYEARERVSQVLLSLPPSTLTIFIASENTDSTPFDDQMAGEVAVSFGHRRALDMDPAVRSRYHRLPWWLPYTLQKNSGGCTLPASLFSRSDPRAWASRKGFAALLSSHYNYPRPQLFNMSSAIGRVDAPGKAFHNIKWPPDLPNHHLNGKVEFLTGYRFNLSPENSLTRGAGGYTTEKLAHAHLAGAVPVYWGDPIDEEVWNPERVIFFNGSNEDEVVGTMRRLQDDEDFRTAWFARPVLAPSAATWVRSWCDVAAEMLRGSVLPVHPS